LAGFVAALGGLMAIGWASLLAWGAFELFTWVEAGMPDAPADVVSLMTGIGLPLLAGSYLIGLVACLFSSVGAAFLVMYSSSDLARLFVAPLTVNQVFILKLLEVMAPQSLWMLLLVLPVTIGFGAGHGVSWIFYPFALYLSMLTIFLPVAAGMLINLLALRLIPAHRVREIGGFIGMLFASIIYAGSQLGARYTARVGPERLAETAQVFRWSEAELSPAWWLARATYAAARGQGSAALGWALLVTFVSLLVVGVSFLLVREAFYGGWAGSGEVWKRRRRPTRAMADGLSRRAPVLAIALKEMRVFARDPGNWAGSLHLIIFVVIGLIMPAAMAGGWIEGWRGGPLRLYLTMGTLCLVHAILAWQMGIRMLSSEGQAWVLLRSTPLTGLQIAWGKALGASGLAIAPGILLVPAIGLAMQARGWDYLALVAAVLFATPGMTALTLASTALFGRVGLSRISRGETQLAVSGWSLLTGSILALIHLGLLGGGAILATAPLDIPTWGRAAGLLALAVFGAGGVIAPAILTGNLIDAGEPARGS
jgi:ABC-2 type transport system permease protein